MDVSSPLKWHGGKGPLASRIVAHFPKELMNYVEPYAGGLSVLFAKEPTAAEIVNDLDSELSNFWACLASPIGYTELCRLANATPFSERVYQDSEKAFSEYQAGKLLLSNIERAHNFLVRCRFSLAGRMNAFASLTKNRLRRGMQEQVSAWLSAVDGLHEVHERLRRVLVLNRDAIKVIQEFDAPHTLFYLDPPYLHSTRTATNVYRYEMNEAQHREMLRTIQGCKGKVILSGYPNALYDSMLRDWRIIDMDVANHAASGESKRRMTERLWLNY